MPSLPHKANGLGPLHPDNRRLGAAACLPGRVTAMHPLRPILQPPGASTLAAIALICPVPSVTFCHLCDRTTMHNLRRGCMSPRQTWAVRLRYLLTRVGFTLPGARRACDTMPASRKRSDRSTHGNDNADHRQRLARVELPARPQEQRMRVDGLFCIFCISNVCMICILLIASYFMRA